jgi:hypothetical protein
MPTINDTMKPVNCPPEVEASFLLGAFELDQEKEGTPAKNAHETLATADTILAAAKQARNRVTATITHAAPQPSEATA